MEAALAPYGLTHGQFVLPACAWHPGGRGEAPSQRALARRAGTDARTVSQVVRSLEAKGLLEREADPRDARTRRLRVTGRGAEVARAAAAAVERADAALFAPAARLDACLDARTLDARIDARTLEALLRALATGRPPEPAHRQGATGAPGGPPRPAPAPRPARATDHPPSRTSP